MDREVEDCTLATSMSSYGIIVPASRHYFIVNAKPGEDVDEVMVLDPSPTHSAMIRDSEDVCSMMFDGGPAYTTLAMEFTTNHGSVASARFFDGSQVFDDQKPMEIARFIVLLESLRADGSLQEKINSGLPVRICGNEEDEDDDEDVEEEIDDDDEEKKVERVEDDVYESEEQVEEETKELGEGEGEEEMCVICQEEYEAEEMIGTLECGHGYHLKCIRKWLVKNKVCPICRFTDFSV